MENLIFCAVAQILTQRSVIYIYIYINYDDNELANKLANALINHKLTI